MQRALLRNKRDNTENSHAKLIENEYNAIWDNWDNLKPTNRKLTTIVILMTGLLIKLSRFNYARKMISNLLAGIKNTNYN